MREVIRLAIFEWKQMDVYSFIFKIFVCISFALFFYLLAGSDEGMNIFTALIDFWFLLMITIYLGMVHGRTFRLVELPPSIWSTPFYTYAKRLPLSEQKIFRSRILVKGLQGPLIIVISICLQSIFQNALPFSFSNLSFYSFLALWAAIAFISISTVLEEIGIRFQKRVHLYSQAWFNIFLLLLLYLIIWVWLVPFDDTFMAFTVFLAAEFPLLNLLISGLIVIVTAVIVLWIGSRRINRKGDVNAAFNFKNKNG